MVRRHTRPSYVAPTDSITVYAPFLRVLVLLERTKSTRLSGADVVICQPIYHRPSNLILRLEAEHRPANPVAVGLQDSERWKGCEWAHKSGSLSLP